LLEVHDALRTVMGARVRGFYNGSGGLKIATVKTSPTISLMAATIKE
jgi:hypothetical protein